VKSRTRRFRGVAVFEGDGTPEGAVPGPPGSLFLRVSDPAAAFIKISGTGPTGFTNTGTHHVEPSGRLLLSSSYRWAKEEGPGSSSYVSRVDECPSS
jgi:hypothetical protein